MATQTTNYGLRKPATNDYVNVQTDLNDNYDIIDSTMKALSDDIDAAEADIATNAANIEQNTSDIAQNAEDISSINTTLTHINNSYTSANPAASSIAGTGVWSIVAELDVSAGTWLFISGVQFAQNGTGTRSVYGNFSSSVTNAGRYSVTAEASSVNAVRLQRVDIASTTGGTFYCYASQNSGTVLEVYAYIRAIRLR